MVKTELKKYDRVYIITQQPDKTFIAMFYGEVKCIKNDDDDKYLCYIKSIDYEWYVKAENLFKDQVVAQNECERRNNLRCA